MLEKIIRIDNVGVLKAAVQSAIKLKNVTVIYADNARGKSTLSSLLRACGTGDAVAIQARKTIGATENQKVQFRFGTPAGGMTASFDGNAWSAPSPTLHVFNQEFVERNVYAGTVVTPDQRAALLELAIGADAVVQRKEFQKQSEEQRNASQKISAAEAALQGYHRGESLNDFLKLEAIDNGPEQLAEIDKLLNEARNTQQIVARQPFRKMAGTIYDFNAIRTIVQSHFERLQEDAEARVREQFDAHRGQKTEQWVSEGLSHKADEHCPFCGQDTTGLPLLQAYKAYFNQAYKDHLKRVVSLRGLVDKLFRQDPSPEWRAVTDFNAGAIEGWLGVLPLQLPAFDMDSVRAAVVNARAIVDALVEQKAASPLDVLDAEALEKAETILNTLIDGAAKYNGSIEALNEKIKKYKSNLTQSDIADLQKQRALIELRMVRNAPEVIQHIADRQKAEGERREAETKKNAARAQLDTLTEQSLSAFQTDINKRLQEFGAPFSIEQLRSNYLGGGVPRGEYCLGVRGTTVQVGPSPSGALTFHTALSEGDKRTLAFAFFLARLSADPKQSEAVVVLDDVFTSLDSHRRAKTVESVVAMSQKCAQVIALGHDAHFLRDIKKRATKLGREVAALELRRGQGNFTVIEEFDLDEFCASAYYKRYRLVEGYLAGMANGKQLEVAQALRLLIEGHLHRCFPSRFADGLTFGAMVQEIKQAQTGNPIEVLKPMVEQLNSFNNYAASFHHDTSAGEMQTDVSDGELQHFAAVALGFIRSGTFP